MSKNPDKMQAGQTCCGFASIIGLPNAGKSTLMNALVGAKVSIVSKRAQTTRTRVLGIAMHENAQIILLDTPGIFAARKSFEQFMVGAAFEALDEAELTIHLVDAGQKGALAQNQMIIDKLRADSKPCLLVLNKTDKIQKPDLLALAAAFNAAYPYEATYDFRVETGRNTGFAERSGAPYETGAFPV
ncbi:MAG: GTPase Era [Alphaproteobacteria bacterium]